MKTQSHSHVGWAIYSVATVWFVLPALFSQDKLAQDVGHDDPLRIFQQKLQSWNRKRAQRLDYIRSNRQTTDVERFMFDALEPEWDCEVQDRIGRPFGDGGKFVCGFNAAVAANAACLVYSVGSNYDASFEQDVRSRSACEIHTFDPTMNITDMDSVSRDYKFRVHGVGLGCKHEACKLGTVEPLSAIMATLGHAQKTLTILKVDCEGREYDAFDLIFADCAAGRVTIDQLQIELHTQDFRTAPPYQAFNFSRIERFFAGADSCGLMVSHKERNHWGCDGYRCVEFSFISKAAAWSAFKASRRLAW